MPSPLTSPDPHSFVIVWCKPDGTDFRFTAGPCNITEALEVSRAHPFVQDGYRALAIMPVIVFAYAATDALASQINQTLQGLLDTKETPAAIVTLPVDEGTPVPDAISLTTGLPAGTGFNLAARKRMKKGSN